MTIKPMMPKTKWLVILASLAVVVSITALTIPKWRGPVRSVSPRKPAATASGTADSRLPSLRALLNDGGPDDGGSDYFKTASPALVAAAAGSYNQRFYRLGELLVQ